MTTPLQRYRALYAGGSYRWNAGAPEGTPVVVTYSFMERRPAYLSSGDHPNFRTTTTTQRRHIRSALARYSAVTGLRFVEVADGGDGGAIRFGQVSISGNTAGYAYYPGTSGIAGDVLLDHTSSIVPNPAPGGEGFELLLHEIGHALGLKHPFSGSHTLPASEDRTSNTAMSYTDNADFSTVRPYDQEVLRRLYGSSWPSGIRYSYNASRKTMTFTGSANADRIIGTVGRDVIRGGAGNDRLWSGGGNGNHLRGEAGADTLTGGSGQDTLEGGAGRDVLVGDFGADTFILTGDGDRAHGLSGDRYDSDTDTASYATLSQAIVVSRLSGGTASIKRQGAQVADRLYGMDRLIAGSGNDRITYNPFKVVQAGAGNDEIQRTIYSTGSIDGGAGTDTVNFDTRSGNATITRSGGVVTVRYSGLTYTLRNVEILSFTNGTVNARLVRRQRANPQAGSAAPRDPVESEPETVTPPAGGGGSAHPRACPCCRLDTGRGERGGLGVSLFQGGSF